MNCKKDIERFGSNFGGTKEEPYCRLSNEVCNSNPLIEIKDPDNGDCHTSENVGPWSE